MFEYFGSPDGHYGLAAAHEKDRSDTARKGREVRCLICGARYRMLDRLDALGRPVVRV